MANGDFNGLVKQPGDDHVHLIAGQHIKLCQQTMSVEIDKAQNTAEKAHRRLDDACERLRRLDDKETGKVTQMWKAYKSVVFYLVVAGLVSFGASYLGAKSSPSVDISAVVKAAVDQALKNNTP